MGRGKKNQRPGQAAAVTGIARDGQMPGAWTDREPLPVCDRAGRARAGQSRAGQSRAGHVREGGAR